MPAAGLKVVSGYEDYRPRIEIVPLLDVVFLLLVFFIYAMLSMTVYHGVHVDLPSGHGRQEAVSATVISLTADGRLWVEGQVMGTMDAVRHAAARHHETDAAVVISGDRAANLGVAVPLLTALRDAGVESVSFHVKADIP